MTINSAGNVGIGTTSPEHLLSIYGTPVLDGALNVVQKISSNASYLTAPTSGIGFGANWASGGNNAVLSGIAGGKENTNNSDFAGVLIFYTRPNGGNHTEHMRITSVGSVGIGTTSPVAKLDVNGTSNFAANVYHSIGGQKFFAGSGGTYAYIYTGTTALNFINGNDTSTLMTLLNGGNVGIGTTSPTAKLDVSGGGLSVSGWSNNNSGTSGGVEIGFDGTQGIFQVYDRVNANYEPILINGSYTMFYISGTERARFNTNGNLGIGTTSPDTLLNVHGANPFIRISNTSGDDHGIKISYGSSDSYGLHLLYNASNALSYIDNTYPVSAGYVYGDIYFRQKVSGTMTTRMTIKADGGNVGIGTTSPGYKLDVNGSCHATCFPTSSDIRFKKKITPLENSLEKIKKLQGVKYEWNEFVNSRRDGYKLNVPIIGLIAQDVEKVIPEIIDLWKLSDDCQDARSIEYPRLIPFLIEAIKEQQYQIEDLKNRLTVLENK